MNTGERIKQARLEKGWSQEELGKRIGVHRAAVNKYEKETVINLKRSTIEKLALALDVSPVWLMCMDDGEDEKPAEGEFSGLSEGETGLISCYRVLNDEGKKKIYDYAKDLSEMEKYKKAELLSSAG